MAAFADEKKKKSKKFKCIETKKCRKVKQIME